MNHCSFGFFGPQFSSKTIFPKFACFDVPLAIFPGLVSCRHDFQVLLVLLYLPKFEASNNSPVLAAFKDPHFPYIDCQHI